MLFQPIHIKQIQKILKNAGFHHAVNYAKAKRDSTPGYIIDARLIKLHGLIDIHHRIPYQDPIDWETNGKIMLEETLKYKEALEKEGILCFISETSKYFPILHVIAEENEKTPLYIERFIKNNKSSIINKKLY